jgi:hypothetical protein
VLEQETLVIDLSSDIMIPRVAVASSWVAPVAAICKFMVFNAMVLKLTVSGSFTPWTNNLELASIEVDTHALSFPLVLQAGQCSYVREYGCTILVTRSFPGIQFFAESRLCNGKIH